MTKTNKLRTGIFAIAMMLLCNPQGWAQSGKSKGNAEPAVTTIAGQTSASRQATSMDELARIKSDYQSNPELTQFRINLWEANHQLEEGLASNSLSQQQINDLKATIAALQSKINLKTTGNINGATGKQGAPKKITRADFMNMTADNQKRALTKEGNIEISDLVNATAADLDHPSAKVSYITMDDFSKNYDILKKMHVLNNPDTYKIVQK